MKLVTHWQNVEHRLELSARLSSVYRVRIRSRQGGSLHLCVVANPAYDYFTDEIAGLAPERVVSGYNPGT